MKVILKQHVETLGKAGDTVKVADGYGRNFLIPKGLAVEANTRNLKTFEHEKQRILQHAEKIHQQAEDIAKKLGGVTCSIARRVGEQEKLFGSVGVKIDSQAWHGHSFRRAVSLERSNWPVRNAVICLPP